MDAVTLSISEVREEILRAMGDRQPAGPGEPSTALIGRIFHEVFAALLGGGEDLQWTAALTPETLSGGHKLLEHVYDKLLGPRLTAYQASLQEAGAQVLSLWEAVQQMSAWLTALLEAAARDNLIGFDRATQRWSGVERLCVVEQPLTWTLEDSTWSGPVQVSGVADALWRNPQTGNWCVVEYKIGRTAPEADAAQACLYHEMLLESGLVDTKSPGAMAVVAFLPGREEHFFEGPKLQAAQKELRKLIGRLAGVLPSQAQSAAQLPEPAAVPKREYQELGQKLVAALEQYGPVVELRGSPMVGPAFLRYTIMPGRSVRVASIMNKAEDLQIRLGLEHTPMIQKVDGKLVIDVQRPDRVPVMFSSIRNQLPQLEDRAGASKLLLGVDLSGKARFADLAQTPHILVAGTSGSGKTEWLRSAIAALLCSHEPAGLRLVLIDPKRNAFGDLKGSPFLLDSGSLVYPPEQSMIDVLDRLIAEMEERYGLFEKYRASDLAEYIAQSGDERPRIICLCDEYADVVAIRRERKEIEEQIRRLGAKARAAGIHLVIATQYPRADIVDGALKANLPGRVCLRTTNYTQSNVVLGSSGAERLLGQGDLFWVDIGDPVRLQAPLLTAEERVRVFGGRAPFSLSKGAVDQRH